MAVWCPFCKMGYDPMKGSHFCGQPTPFVPFEQPAHATTADIARTEALLRSNTAMLAQVQETLGTILDYLANPRNTPRAFKELVAERLQTGEQRNTEKPVCPRGHTDTVAGLNCWHCNSCGMSWNYE